MGSRARALGPRRRVRTAIAAVACALLPLVARGQNPCDQLGVQCADAEAAQRAVARRWRPAVASVLPPSQWERPRACPADARGSLEPLLPEEHFRGPLSGPRTYFRRVPPHYLGFHSDFGACGRKVYIDVGARTFGSAEGMLAMFKLYPPLARFDEFHALEAVGGLYRLPNASVLTPKLRRLGMTAAQAASFEQRHTFHHAFVGARSDASTVPPTIGFPDFLRRTLRLQPADAVVVKMDVEGYEYDIVNALLADGSHALVDELMLEAHYGHPKMTQMFNWCRPRGARRGAPSLLAALGQAARRARPRGASTDFWCEYTLDNATALYQSLRDAGVYAHHWP